MQTSVTAPVEFDVQRRGDSVAVELDVAAAAGQPRFDFTVNLSPAEALDLAARLTAAAAPR
jgi:hypothetical protein